MSNLREMTPQRLHDGSRKRFKLLKYENIIYSFEALDLEISNMKLLLRNVQISRFYEHFKKFPKSVFAHILAKFKYFAKHFILTESPDHVLQIFSQFCRIKGCGGAGCPPPPPTNNFRKTLVTQTNYISSGREFIGESESLKILGNFDFAIL